MLEFDESLKILHSHIKPYERVEKVAITQCLDRVLAEDIKALKNHPQIPTASMDGYAVKYNEQSETLKILGLAPAGSENEFKLGKNECVKTFTGSLMCKNSDTLVPVENVLVEDGMLFIKQKVAKGFAVRKVGESYQKGDILLRKGAKLGFSEIALLAELGIFHVSVFIKPIVGILSSGNEIKDLGECLENSAQIHSSNHVALANLAKKCGCETRIFPLLKDDEKEIKKAIKSALMSCDILVTTGGVSVGDFDFLKLAMKEYEVLVDKVNIKPGRHIKIAKFEEKFIFALPGFPYSALVLFQLFVRELINTWLLQENSNIIEAFLREDFVKKSPFLEFVAVNLEFEKGKIYANLQGKKQGSSAIITNLLHQSALMRVQSSLEKEDLVTIVLI